MPADQLYLIGDKILHIPVGLGTAESKDKIGQRLSAHLPVVRPGGVPLVVGQKDWHLIIIDLLGRVDLHSVHDPVGPAVQDDAFYIGKRLELLQRDVVGMDLTVDPQRADLAGQTRILLTTQIQNNDHVLPHCSTSYIFRMGIYNPTISVCRNPDSIPLHLPTAAPPKRCSC